MTLVRGVDVARYQSITNWPALAKAVDFVIVKATEGNNFTSPTWSTYYAGAGKAGLLRGSYHFGQPNAGRGTSVQQADYYVGRLLAAGFKTGRDIPPALDIESTGGLDKTALTAWCLNFVRHVDARLGLVEPWHRCGVYLNNDYRHNRLDGPTLLAGRWLWLAAWPAAYRQAWPPDSARPVGAALWQFSSSLHVAGITENVDTNVARTVDLHNLAPDYYKDDDMPITDADADKIARKILTLDGVIPNVGNKTNPFVTLASAVSDMENGLDIVTADVAEIRKAGSATAAELVTALKSDAGLLAAFAKAVNDDAARRLKT